MIGFSMGLPGPFRVYASGKTVERGATNTFKVLFVLVFLPFIVPVVALIGVIQLLRLYFRSEWIKTRIEVVKVKNPGSE